MSFFAGIVTDVGEFFGNLEHEIQTDLAPGLAKMRTAFTTGLGYLAKAEWQAAVMAVKTQIAANPLPASNFADYIDRAVYAVLNELEANQVHIGEMAIRVLVTTLIAAA